MSKKKQPNYKIIELAKNSEGISKNHSVLLTNKKDDRVMAAAEAQRGNILTKALAEDLCKKDMQMQEIVNIHNILLLSPNYRAALKDVLEILGKMIEVDTIHIYENRAGMGGVEKNIRTEYKWFRTEAEPFACKTENVSYESLGLEEWYDILAQGQMISGFVEDVLSPEKEILQSKGIVYFLAVPIMVNNRFWGFIELDDYVGNYSWSESEKSVLNVVATGIASAIKRTEDDKKIKKALKNEFSQTIQQLENLIFKVRKDPKGTFYFTLFEGKTAQKIGMDTKMVYGKGTDQILSEQTSEAINDYFERVFKGEVCSFEFDMKDHVLYATVSPIWEGDAVVEAIGTVLDITERIKAQEQIKYIAYYDQLTGLPNRASLFNRLDTIMDEGKQSGKMIGILFFDLDRFRVINETLGHGIGDQLIKRVAKRLKGVIHDKDQLLRLGGDDFVLFLPQVESKIEVEETAKKILEVFKQPFGIKNRELFITTSIGISMYPEDGEDKFELVKNADIALYRAKEEGRNRYLFYRSTMNARALERLTIENNLRRALEREEFFLLYQPQVDLQSGKIVGCEALIRWNHPELGMVSPVDFIPLAEDTGLIIPIGEWILYEACMQNKAWHDAGYDHLRMSVNISVRQFEQSNLVELVERVLRDTKLNPAFLDLEITESCIMQNINQSMEVIRELKALGVSISIDDFGTGFSSLSYLKRFAVDALKIDQSFIRDLTVDRSDSAITTAIIDMAHSLNLKVVAEGVETKEQLVFLKNKNCNMMQGYLVSKPIAFAEFETILQNAITPIRYEAL